MKMHLYRKEHVIFMIEDCHKKTSNSPHENEARAHGSRHNDSTGKFIKLTIIVN